ncbi:HEPN domain-containing protein [bacterium]|nr:HEPN domain-containing protein [bacterium]
MIDARHEAGRWLSQAQRDLDDARFNLEGTRNNVACFMAQQAAEKSLKAFLYGQGEEIVWGHSASDLCKRCSAFDPEFQDILASASALDKYYIPTRYPNGLPGGIPSDVFDAHDASRALSLADEVVGFVSRKMAAEK